MRCILLVVQVTMYAWYFAVSGGVIGPFVDKKQCEEIRGKYITNAWKSECWEFKRGWTFD